MPLHRPRARDGSAYFRFSLDDYAGWLQSTYGGHFLRHDGQPHAVPPPSEVADAAPVSAVIDNDRWVVVCPDCGAAQYVWLEAPLLMCAGCMNASIGYRWRRIALPPAAEREEIEAILGHRQKVGDRNWSPSESIADLRRENRENGEDVPPARGGGR